MAVIALQSASSALNALNTQMDVLANNLANINTTGYKASRTNFQDLLYIERQQPGVENANNDQRPTGLYVGLGVKVSGTQQTFEQGAPESTGNPLDLMIDGLGFFKVSVEAETAAGGVAYTRAGNFTVNSDGELVLANSDGRRLEPAITIPDDAETLTVTSDGRVFVSIPGDADPQEVGQIELANFVNPAGLKQIGSNLWAESTASGPPIEGNPTEENRGGILQGMLERSNVDPTRELIGLITTQRAFEMNSQSIRAADETLRAIGQLRR
ncbi:MAG: flagellar basal-body rod protein FlgG [Phycisphaerales bacterium JB040]